MNQKKVGSKDPTEQVGRRRSSLSAPTQEVAATRLLCLLTILLPFQDIFNIPPSWPVTYSFHSSKPGISQGDQINLGLFF